MTDVSAFLIASCFAVFLLYTAVRAIRLRPREKRRFQIRFGFLLAFLVLAFLFRRSFPTHVGRVLWPQTITTDILADLVAIAGLILFFLAHRALGRNWSPEVVIQEKHELIETGPYAYVRHPLYSGVLLMFLGLAVYCGRKVCIIYFVACFFGIYFKSQMEERLLTKTFPAYSEYKRRTKALIPFIW